MLTKQQLKKVVIKEGSDLRAAMFSIKETGLGMAVVVDKYDHVVGLVSDGDIRQQLLINEDMHIPVTSCMSKDFVYVNEGCQREEVLKLLDVRIRQIPVLDSKGCLVGIVGSGYNSEDLKIISRARTPARVSLAGGGTDFTEYFLDHGGAGLSCTIAKYSHAVLRKRTDRKITIYSHDFRESANIDSIEDIQYDGKLDLIKAGIKLLKPNFGFDIQLGCDFSPSSGLGGSASLLASVIGCLNEFKEHRLDRYAIAEYAFEAERIELEVAGGWQDQYSTVFGGFNYLEFDRKHNTVMPIKLEDVVINEIEERLIVCHTKKSHLGSLIQKDKNLKRTNSDDKNKYAERLKNLTIDMKQNLLRAKYDDFARLLEETWSIKKELNPNVTSPELDEIHSVAISAGALGGRLLGTGGGGYFLFYVPPFTRYSVLDSLEKLGLQPETMKIDQKGLTSWIV
jgi:D-glycero-alpha-D-manno-heptose-7-phosphate kinase